MKYYSISVIIPTFNSELTIGKCLSSIRKQNYPQNKIKIILADGGSRDNTKEIAEKYKVVWISIDPKKQNVEYNKSIGISRARGQLLLMLDHDNILQDSNIIRSMVEPFAENKKLVGVETYRYFYNPKASLLDRYIALFGVIEPLAWYLGKADRMSMINDGYDNKYQPIDKGKYFLVNFSDKNLPTIGANGFMVNRKILIQNADIRPGKFFPIDVNVDLVRKGFTTYAFTKNSITHLSGHGKIRDYLRRRMLFVKQYHFNEKNIKLNKARRYSLYEPKDFWKLVYFVLIGITIVVPLFDSVKGYLKIKDTAWFIHPILCFGFVMIYGWVIINHQLRNLEKRI